MIAKLGLAMKDPQKERDLLQKWDALQKQPTLGQFEEGFKVHWGTATEALDKRNLLESMRAQPVLRAMIPDIAEVMDRVDSVTLDGDGNPLPISQNPAVEQEIWDSLAGALTAMAVDKATQITGSGTSTPSA